ncbi:hypothetical protein [Mycetocola reblochoni]|uniref:YtxH domain-containing protein n=2 Tax=Mycetocola reblochoni TaxID=331618 RepID=A0A1R4IRM6_9MICO|nr:hypothetical protein [Mycetocola reblochoni]RLP71139.1 hypothetical protein D9V30_01620 [Mycetocola reblochoni]SJN22551.1 Small hypothetical protein Hyp1 [Mycetocola reblochoni REB411]
MKGKILFVAGLATGYVLGTRAGRKRYEQIRSGWLSVWNTRPVQNQVHKAEDFAKARLSGLPSAVASGLGSVFTALGNRGSTPGEKLDATIASARSTVDEAAKAVDDAAAAAKKKPSGTTKTSSSTTKKSSKKSASSSGSTPAKKRSTSTRSTDRS